MKSRRLIDRFTDDFIRNLSHDLSREQTFYMAKKQFEDVCGFTPYRSYQSYKSAVSNDRRKRETKKKQE